ncbi:MAG: type II toxin-antitoxin system RelE/ParE family toxin [Coriobacteriia bacterium]|nr:type II toxin-antitoxin system RelE/ParE family toxin [Coriobacteriia bacterium]
MSGRRGGYELRYLPLFWEDLDAAVAYIAGELRNPAAAGRLLDATEEAILAHSLNPAMAAVYRTTRERPLPYHWFEVGNYMVFYVVDGDVMELRRFLYKRRDIGSMVP